MKKRSVRSTGHSPNILEATTTAHPIRPLFSLFFPLFFRSLFSFFSFLLSPPSLFPYAPPFVRALSRVFDYENLVLRGRRVQPRSCIPRNDDRQGRIRLSDFNSCDSRKDDSRARTRCGKGGVRLGSRSRGNGYGYGSVLIPGRWNCLPIVIEA